MYLIDTMVLSELRRRQRDAGGVAWIAEQRQEDCVVKDISVLANSLVIVLNPMILVGLATVAAKRFSQKRQPVFLNLLDTGGGFKEVCWCRGLSKKSRRLRRH